MPLNITTNSAAASASYYLGKKPSALQKSSMTSLASGKKIIAPYDDPGSLSVSMKLQASINRLEELRIIFETVYLSWKFRTGCLRSPVESSTGCRN